MKKMKSNTFTNRTLIIVQIYQIKRNIPRCEIFYNIKVIHI